MITGVLRVLFRKCNIQQQLARIPRGVKSGPILVSYHRLTTRFNDIRQIIPYFSAG